MVLGMAFVVLVVWRKGKVSAGVLSFEERSGDGGAIKWNKLDVKATEKP